LTIVPNRDEVQQVRWFTRDELDKFMRDARRNEHRVSPWFALIYTHYLQNWWDNLTNLERVADTHLIRRLN
jgi:isopentenyldiphosphate isomerase